MLEAIKKYINKVLDNESFYECDNDSDDFFMDNDEISDDMNVKEFKLDISDDEDDELIDILKIRNKKDNIRIEEVNDLFNNKYPNIKDDDDDDLNYNPKPIKVSEYKKQNIKDDLKIKEVNDYKKDTKVKNKYSNLDIIRNIDISTYI